MRAQHSQVASSQGREFGVLHCKLGHRVQIEPGLRPQSPKNGSFSRVRQRLLANPLLECPKSELGDWWLIRENPPLAGLSANIRDPISEGRTGWLGREDSNLRMVESKSANSSIQFKEHSELSRSVLPLRTLSNLRRSERAHSAPPQIFQRDDGAYQVGLDVDAPGPFPTLQFAQAIAALFCGVDMSRLETAKRVCRIRCPVKS